MTVHWLALVVVLVSPVAAAGGGAKATPPATPDRPLLALGWMLTATDPPDPVLKKSPRRVHEVQLEAGKTYQIDLESDDFDVFLRVEDARGKQLAEDDDSGGGLNARLFFTPPGSARYRLIATAFPKGQPRGVYSLTVRLADRKTLGEPELKRLNNAAAQELERGRLEEAIRLLREALRLCEELYPKTSYPDGHAQFAGTLNTIGRALHQMGKREEARVALQRALDMRTRALKPGHPLLATYQNNLAGVLLDLGRTDEALALYRAAYESRKQALPPGHPFLAQSLNNLGLAVHAQGKFEEARSYYQQALDLLRDVPADAQIDRAQPLMNLGRALADLGKLDEARACLEGALAVRKEELPAGHPDIGKCLNALGWLMQIAQRPAEARRYHEEALALRRKALPPVHPDLATSLNNLGTVLQSSGEHAPAREYLEQALAILRKTVPGDHPDLGTILNNLGNLLLQAGEGKRALPYYEEALAIRRKSLPPDHPYLAQSLDNLGELYWGMGRRDEGWELISAAVSSAARYARRVATATAQRRHADLILRQRPLVEVLLSAAAGEQTLSEARRQELLLRVLQAKGISTAALGSRRDVLLSGADPKARALADELLPLQRRLANLMLQGPAPGAPEAYRDACVDLQRKIDNLEEELGLQVQAFALLQQTHTATPKDLAARLPSGAVLIETVRHGEFHFPDGQGRRGQQWGPPRYAALVLGRGVSGPQVRLVDLGAAEPLEAAIRAWRAAAQGGKSDARAERALRERLWEPLAAVLPRGTTRLVVAPEGALSLVPLEAIRLGDGKYLIEHYAVQYVSTGRDLMPLPRPKERSEVALVLADPDYQRLEGVGAKGAAGLNPAALRAGLAFQSLPGFAREADAVERLLRAQKGWRVEQARGPDASEERLAAVRRPRLLHCVTHGFFLEDIQREPFRELFRDLALVDGGPLRLPSFAADARLRSGLALAGANKWQERSAKGLSDGLLTALEVENLDLWGTELVVLSACDTGRGEIQVGEGVLGLRRAFQLAGAQTVLASLWKVPDAETEQLMTDTLSRWLKGTPPHEALREAQLSVIRQLRKIGERNGKQEAPPLYWAGFVCHGR